MTTERQSGEPYFRENVRIPIWGILLLGLILGITAGVLTGVAVRNIFGDEPLMTGGELAVFYITFALAVIIDLFLLFNFTNLVVSVTERGFNFHYGLFGKSFSWDQLKGVEATDYSWITYGGWGVRFSTKGRRAWSQLGVKRGVVVDVNENGKGRRYFVSSTRPQELAAALANGIGTGPPQPQQVEPAPDQRPR